MTVSRVDYTVVLITIHLESAFLADGYAQSGWELKSRLEFIDVFD